MAAGNLAKAAAQGAKLAVKYGPQAKIVWDKGGRQATMAAAKSAQTVNARRRALKHAGGVLEGSVLKIAPEGTTVYVVFSGDKPIAAYPPQEAVFSTLLEHADLSKRVRSDEPVPRLRDQLGRLSRPVSRRDPGARPRELS